MNSNNQKMSVIRQRTQNLATTISPLSSHFLSMTSFKLHHAVNGLILLTAIVSPTWAFSTVPQPIRNNYAVSTELEGGNHIGYSRHVCLQASEDDSSNESNIEEDEDDEVDIITQKLRRNAQNGPINSCMKEHDKMMKENVSVKLSLVSLFIYNANTTLTLNCFLYRRMKQTQMSLAQLSIQICLLM